MLNILLCAVADSVCAYVDAYAIGCGVLATIEQWYPTRKFNGTMVPHKRNSKVWPGLVTKEKTMKYPTSAICTVCVHGRMCIADTNLNVCCSEHLLFYISAFVNMPDTSIYKMKYCREELLNFRYNGSTSKPPIFLHQSIYDLGIHKCSHRGRRAGSHIHRKIAVIDHRQRNNVVVSNLHFADRPQQVLAKFRTAPHQQCYQLLTFYLCNARSVRNKIAEFTDLVCERKPDLLVLTETWLGCNDCAVRTQIMSSWI